MNKNPIPRAIAAIVLDPKGCLILRPDLESHQDYSFIYRDASGIRWSEQEQGFIAYEPERWDPTALLRQVAIAVRNEYNEQLQLTPQTQWLGIDSELKARLEGALAGP